VSLVAILDADKEGFLRSTRSLIQTFGRAARNVSARVIMYADQVTGSMARAMEETSRRRSRQISFNEEHGIVPASIVKQGANTLYEMHHQVQENVLEMAAEEAADFGRNKDELEKDIRKLEKEMRSLAKELEFEKAARVRDRIESLKKYLML
ncbi:MAG: UvrB/UvrC motif-containing protein, partial [Desulfonatronovibrionaceae bacterium]